MLREDDLDITKARRARSVVVPPIFDTIKRECDERGWTIDELAGRMCREWERNRYLLHMLEHVHLSNAALGEDGAAELGRAFGVSAQYWLELDQQHRQWIADKYQE